MLDKIQYDTTIKFDVYVYCVFWAGGLYLLNKLMLCYVMLYSHLLTALVKLTITVLWLVVSIIVKGHSTKFYNV